MLVFTLASAAVLFAVEAPRGSPIDSYGEALFTTWITMTTVGYGNLVPVTPAGQVIVSLDAIVGLVLVGMIVWFVTGSLGASEPPDRPDGGSGEQRDV
jgi:voltage-gated potassium channel